jgi:hypothetical protein
MRGMDEKELISRAMSVIGARTSLAKAATSRENGRRGGRPRGTGKPLAEISCNCGAVADDAHKATCPRGRAFRRRQKQNEAASTR